MGTHLRTSDEYELVRRDSDSDDFDLDAADYQHGRPAQAFSATEGFSIGRLRSIINLVLPRRLKFRAYRQLPYQKSAPRSRSKRRRKCYLWLHVCFIVLIAAILITSVLSPSYTKPPKHYQALRDAAHKSENDSPANPENEKIFIAASIYDQGGDLLGGAWGRAVLGLIELLGSQNVYLSIYENHDDATTGDAMAQFKEKVSCKYTIISERKYVIQAVPQVELPDGSRRVKRIAFLAEVRNKALDPLEEEAADTHFDKVLFLNDVIFDPIDAAQLLMSTHLGEDGRTSYRAACAVDFVNPFKFYDTYATRDAEGFSMGVPFFPWFTGAGKGLSRRDVLQGKDAVRVKSCWGGMVAFDAEPFQAQQALRFRASPDLYWDASECCLIHADLIKGRSKENDRDTGIYMNPYVRVAYGSQTLKLLGYIKRFEKLFALPHALIDRLVGLPWFNPRRTEQSGEKVKDKVWVANSNLDTGGSFQVLEREANGDGYCGRKGLQLLRESPRDGEKNWEEMPVP